MNDGDQELFVRVYTSNRLAEKKRAKTNTEEEPGIEDVLIAAVDIKRWTP